MKFRPSVALLCALSVVSTACINVDGITGKKHRSTSNKVTQTSEKVDELIGDDEVELQVISNKALQDAKLEESILELSSPRSMTSLSMAPFVKIHLKKKASKTQKSKTTAATSAQATEAPTADNSLHVSYPMSMLGQQNIFGGVITKVSDQNNTALGSLKLTDLSPIHFRPLLNQDEKGNYLISLVGCLNDCNEGSQQVPFMGIPIVGFNPDTNSIILDLAAIGKSLDLISLIDAGGKATKLKTVLTETTQVEFDMKTLIFDIKTTMIPISVETPDDKTPITEFTSRWYIKLNSDANPAFMPRLPTEGVGFFTTLRGSERKITRRSLSDNGTGMPSIKYYIKNVPDQYKKSMAKAFDNWNIEFQNSIHRDLFSYEFIDQGHKYYDQIVTGDIRYNVIEWDTTNVASYAGLGPSIANQYTGEIMSGNVLIQGARTVANIHDWYVASGKATQLMNEGKIEDANLLMKNFHLKVAARLKKLAGPQFSVNLTDELHLTVQSQRDDLKDPLIRGTFEIVPEGVSFEEYIDSYLTSILVHELGHNLGLRHNFKGSLGASEVSSDKIVTRSIMDYFDNHEAYLNKIGDYDRMSIAYGYQGQTPGHKNWYCTDEDVATSAKELSTKSPECFKFDASSDPFSYWEGKLTRALELILETKSTAAPVWSIKEVENEVANAVAHLGGFILSANNTSSTWDSFFGKEGRPTSKDGIKAYVLERIKTKLCDSNNFEVIVAKETNEAQQLALDNYVGMVEVIGQQMEGLKLFTVDELACQ